MLLTLVDTSTTHICLYSLHSSLLLCIHPHFLQWLLYEEDFLYVVQLVLSLQDQEYIEGMIFAAPTETSTAGTL